MPTFGANSRCADLCDHSVAPAGCAGCVPIHVEQRLQSLWTSRPDALTDFASYWGMIRRKPRHRTFGPTLLTSSSRNLCLTAVCRHCAASDQSGQESSRIVQAANQPRVGNPCHIRVPGCQRAPEEGTRTFNFRINSLAPLNSWPARIPCDTRVSPAHTWLGAGLCPPCAPAHEPVQCDDEYAAAKAATDSAPGATSGRRGRGGLMQRMRKPRQSVLVGPAAGSRSCDSLGTEPFRQRCQHRQSHFRPLVEDGMQLGTLQDQPMNPVRPCDDVGRTRSAAE